MLRPATTMLAIPPGLMRWIFGIVLAASLLAMGCNGPDSRARGSIKAGDEAAQQRALREALNHYRTAAVAEPASVGAQMRRGAPAGCDHSIAGSGDIDRFLRPDGVDMKNRLISLKKNHAFIPVSYKQSFVAEAFAKRVTIFNGKILSQ